MSTKNNNWRATSLEDSCSDCQNQDPCDDSCSECALSYEQTGGGKSQTPPPGAERNQRGGGTRAGLVGRWREKVKKIRKKVRIFLQKFLHFFAQFFHL